MHVSEFLHQPINVIISCFFVLLFGLVVTSLMLNAAGLPDPMTSFGESIGLVILDHIFGATPVTTSS